MPYRICKRIEIDNAHMLSKHAGSCRFPHGHTRQVEFVLEADGLDEHDMVCDFALLKRAVQEFVGSLDHAMCVSTDDPRYPQLKALFGERVVGFDGCDPTTEVMARRLFDCVAARLAELRGSSAAPAAPDVRLLKVRIWETTTCWAEYEG